ncbi:MAG: hypothetical protein QF472_03815 [Candidatus Marinimicrobia bacterium]|nr:hypothetical protein [Candidatus Neomarinimicrobiota bacterium]
MKILGPPVITFIFLVIFMGLLIQYHSKLSKQKFWYRLFLLSLRSITILLLLLLLLNPWMKWLNIEMESQKIAAIIDNSESMQYHLENKSIQIKDISKKIYKWEDTHSLDLSIYSLNEINYDSDFLLSDFTKLPTYIRNQSPDQVLFISDGVATMGKELSSLQLPEHIPFHTIGVGPAFQKNDIRIDNVYSGSQFSPEDTVLLSVDIASQVNASMESILEIINGNGEDIYQEKVNFTNGFSERKVEIKIPAHRLSALNHATLSPLTDESQLSNNKHSFKINMINEADQVIMISGGLSPNTGFIKDCLSSFDNIETMHFYKTDSGTWNNDFHSDVVHGSTLIIFDDFPAYNADQSIFSELSAYTNQNQIPIIYFEGPHSNLSNAEKMNTVFPFLKGLPIDPDIESPIAHHSHWTKHQMVEFENFPPQQRNVKWETDAETWLNFEDNSALTFQHSNFFFLGIPELMSNHLKLQKNGQSPVKKLTEILLTKAIYKNKGMLNLLISGDSFSRGERITGRLKSMSKFPLNDITLSIEHTIGDTLTSKCKKIPGVSEYDCSFRLAIAGEYSVSVKAKLPDGTQLRSNTLSIVVQDINLELQDLVQNITSLKLAAHKTGGNYVYIDSLDSLLANLEINPVRVETDLHLSGLSSQAYWWVLILLLAIEWYFRKDIGFL